MSRDAVNFLVNTKLGSRNKLKVYYDFDYEAAFLNSEGGVYQGYVENTYPSINSGLYPARINRAVSDSSFLADYYLSGELGFLHYDRSGDFRYYTATISGSPDVNFNEATFLINFSATDFSSSVLLGAFSKYQTEVAGQTITAGKGINIGINDRGKIFVQGLNANGEFVLTANSIELAPKNIIAVSVGSSNISIMRFDMLNQAIQKEDFSLNTSLILNPDEIHIGSASNFYLLTDTGAPSLFNGYISDVAIFSGVLPSRFLMNFSSGFVSDYYYNSGVVQEVNQITGYTTTIIYKTGVIGYEEVITGYATINSGVPFVSGNWVASGTTGVYEGTIVSVPKEYGGYLYFEKSGFLHPSLFGTYTPSGQHVADATRGLSSLTGQFLTYVESTGIYENTVNVPLYGTQAITGTLSEISGYVQIPLSGTTFITGAASSGVNMSSYSSEEWKKNAIYYFGPR